MTQRVLVTGSSGFMGGHLLPVLEANGYETLGLDSRPPPSFASKERFVVCDILDLDKLRSVFFQYKPDIVVHLAARTDLNENKDIEGYW